MLKSEEIRAKVCVGLKSEALNNLENENGTLIACKNIHQGYCRHRGVRIAELASTGVLDHTDRKSVV